MSLKAFYIWELSKIIKMMWLYEKIGVKNSYFLCACLTLIIFIIILGCTIKMPHYDRQFFEGDLALSYYHYENDQVTVPMLYMIILIIPVGTALYLCKYRDISDGLLSKYIAHEIFILWCTFFAYSMLATGVSTEILKTVISRPRPSAFYLCNYLGYTDAVNSGNYTNYNSLMKFGKVGTFDNCYDQSMVSEAFSSFPSGHSSMSFCSMLVTCFIIRTMLNIKNVFTFCGILSYSPLIISAWIAVTRVQDNKHHEDDIFAGIFIGLICTLISWYSFLTITKKINVAETIHNADIYVRLESGNTNSNSQYSNDMEPYNIL